MNEWESSQTSNRLELMMKKNIGHAQSLSRSLSYFLFLVLSVFLFFLFKNSSFPCLLFLRRDVSLVIYFLCVVLLSSLLSFSCNETSVSRDDR